MGRTLLGDRMSITVVGQNRRLPPPLARDFFSPSSPSVYFRRLAGTIQLPRIIPLICTEFCYMMSVHLGHIVSRLLWRRFSAQFSANSLRRHQSCSPFAPPNQEENTSNRSHYTIAPMTIPTMAPLERRALDDGSGEEGFASSGVSCSRLLSQLFAVSMPTHCGVEGFSLTAAIVNSLLSWFTIR
jgi:hypothetical protein